jgi:predicted O-methyltransferase YrrM
MTHEEWVRTLYGSLLRREPNDRELRNWLVQLDKGLDPREVLMRVLKSPGYAAAQGVHLAYPPGHYYSPVVNPELAVKHAPLDPNLPPSELKGLRYPAEAMAGFWAEHAKLLEATSFPLHKDDTRRYYTENPIYPVGDAAILRAIILKARPSRIIEIGSGMSTACMLDTLEEGRLQSAITCIEPYPQRLYASLQEGDRARLTVIERPVQEVPLETFAALGAGDILFIDSTHVMKTGSDVNYELFEILPSLKPGVLIHFHDLHYPFEYPKGWVVDKNFSWNEIYAVRAFLMYNEAFEILFHGSFFVRRNQELVRRTYAPLLRNAGGSLWIRKIR